ncbi:MULTISPECIES: glucose-6-phosphate dehydrogenase [unclassified Microbacterium]|uniref:glucose-6-phosphate dehydrogenase n=1 Tax=unclassified Microbacterium TaxID=2609290 RepID=UPI0037453B4C
MKIVSSADWRDAIPFDTPLVVADVAPGEPARCSGCGGASALRDRSELWAVKHRHPNDHGGFVRFYCEEHRPAAKAIRTDAEIRAARLAPRKRSVPPPRRTPVVEKQRETCPNCFVEVSATGECGICGWSAA